MIRIGTSGWSYAHWTNVLYPEEFAHEGRTLLSRMPRLEAQRKLRKEYQALVDGTLSVDKFEEARTGILDAYLTNVSNRLNEVMKVLTVVSTVFMPLTLLTGIWGMNVHLPVLPGGDEAQFWWIAGLMLVIVVIMLAVFRRRRWI